MKLEIDGHELQLMACDVPNCTANEDITNVYWRPIKFELAKLTFDNIDGVLYLINCFVEEKTVNVKIHYAINDIWEFEKAIITTLSCVNERSSDLESALADLTYLLRQLISGIIIKI